jgi:hypothetical protein
VLPFTLPWPSAASDRVLDGAVLDGAVLDGAVLDGPVLDGTPAGPADGADAAC